MCRFKRTTGGVKAPRDQLEQEVVTAPRLKGQGKEIEWQELWRGGLERRSRKK